jgi:hypothetical protein
MSINLRYQLGRLFRKCDYRLAREHRWPQVHGNLLLPGFSLLRSAHHGLIQLCRSERSKTETDHIERVHILQIDTEGMDYDVLNWFFDADVQPAMINFENLHLGRRERSASRELVRTNGYWWIETSQDTFAIKEFLARPGSGP